MGKTFSVESLFQEALNNTDLLAEISQDQELMEKMRRHVEPHLRKKDEDRLVNNIMRMLNKI